MKTLLLWLKRCGSVCRRSALVAMAIGALNGSLVHELEAAETPKTGAAAPTLPAKPADVGHFVAAMDDRQVRSLLVRVLEERVQASEPRQPDEMLMMVESTTGRLATRMRQIAAAAGEAAAAPSLFWRWLTADGGDSGAPWRAAMGVMILIGLAWGAQAAASIGLRAALRPTIGIERSPRAAAAAMLVRFLALLGALAAAHAVVPEVARPSRLTALAIALTFAGTWIGSLTISYVLPALLARQTLATGMRLRRGILQTALALFFGGLFGLVLLKDAGMSDDARMFIGTTVWLVFGILFLAAFSRRRAATVETHSGDDLDPIEKWLDRHGALLLRLAFVGIFLATPLVALWRGPAGFWSGIASFALLIALVAGLGLARTRMHGPAAADGLPAPPSPWVSTLRRALRFMILVGFMLALAAVWKIDLFHTANTHLGETLVRGIVTLIVTVTLAYLVWELIRTALAQSALGPPRASGERGEEGGGAAATRLQTFGPVLRNFLFVVVITIATLVGLSSLGVNIGPLLAGAGVIGIALGFGAQTLVRDVISGVFFLAEDAFRIGEYVVIGNTRGTVEGIAIRSLKLRHHRGAVHTVPFGEIKQLTNESRDWLILKLEFLLAFDTDLRKVKRIIKEISKQLEADPELGPALLEPIKSQGVRRMEPTGMMIGLKIVAKPGSEVYLIRREVYQRVRDAFEENGIQFARPQVMVTAPAGVAAQLANSPDEMAAAATLAIAPARQASGGA